MSPPLSRHSTAVGHPCSTILRRRPEKSYKDLDSPPQGMCSGLVCAPLAPLGVVLRNQLPNSRHQFVGNLHHCLGRFFKRCLVFCHSFVFGLLFIVGEHLQHPFFIPAWWKSVLSHRCPFRRSRRR